MGYNFCRYLGIDPYEDIDVPAVLDEIVPEWEKEYRSSPNPRRRYTLGECLRTAGEIRGNPAVFSELRSSYKRQIENHVRNISRRAVTTRSGRVAVRKEELERSRGFLMKLFPGVGPETVGNLFRTFNISSEPPGHPEGHLTFEAMKPIGAFIPQEAINIAAGFLGKEPVLTAGSGQSEVLRVYSNVKNALENNRDRVPEAGTLKNVLDSVQDVYRDASKLRKSTEYGLCQKLLDEFDVKEKLLEETCFIPSSEINSLLSRIPEDKIGLCSSILESFCFENSVYADFSGTVTVSRCPECLCMLTREEQYCPECGIRLSIRCPGCGTGQSSGNSSCSKCGRDLDGYKSSCGEMLGEYNALFGRGSLKEAGILLDKMKKIDYFRETEPLFYEKLKEKKLLLDSERKEFEELSKTGNYYAISQKCSEIMKNHQGLASEIFSFGKISEDAESRVNKAREYCAMASEEPDEGRKQELYSEAAAVCPDYPESSAYISEMMPDCIGRTEIRYDGGRVRLDIYPIQTENVKFRIYRSAGGRPFDYGSPVAVIHGTEFTDTDVESGTAYRYSVRPERWGILTTEESVLTIETLEKAKTKFEPVLSGFRISFARPSGARRVRVFKKDLKTGESSELMFPEKACVIEDPCQENTGYEYRVVTEYDIGGSIKTAEEIIETSPFSYPKPLDYSISRNADGTYTLVHDPIDLPVSVFVSETPLYENALIRLDGTEAPVSSSGPGICETTFSLGDSLEYCIHPAIMLNSSYAVFCTGARIRTVGCFSNIRKKYAGGDCVLFMDWPDTAVSARAVLRGNGPDEVRMITFGDYITAGGLAIPSGFASADLYAIHHINAERPESDAVHVNLNREARIRYAAERTKDGITIRIKSDAQEIPAFRAVIASGVPLGIDDGEAIYKSNRIPRSEAEIRFRCGRSGTVRLFFTDDSEYDRYRLICTGRGMRYGFIQ